MTVVARMLCAVALGAWVVVAAAGCSPAPRSQIERSGNGTDGTWFAVTPDLKPAI